MKTMISLFIVLVSFLGILDAGFITYEDAHHIIPPCQRGFQCDTVLQSRFSHIGPLPIAALGLMFYAIVFLFAIINFVELEHVDVFGLRLHTHDILLALSICGALFSVYLVTLMGVILHAWCLYCLFSATLCALNFFLNSYQWKLRQGECSDACSRPRAQVIHWLYVHVLKRIFFLLDPEFVHNRMVAMGMFLGFVPGGKWLTQWMVGYASPSLHKNLNGIEFPGPVGLSAGFDYNGQLTQILPSVSFGFMTIGTITYHPYEGNAVPRLGRFPKSKALLVNKGFKNIGAKAMLEKLSGKTFSIPLGISIGSTNMIFSSEAAQIDDVIKCFKLFEKSNVQHAYYELNISCPNTKGGQPFTTPARLKRLLIQLEKLKIKKPIYIKMPIDLPKEDIKGLLAVADRYTIAGVIFGNLTKDHMNPDVHPADREKWATMKGNLSGKPTWKRSNELIKLTRKTYKKRFTIIGTGGIFSGEDAHEKMKCGADLVQLITGMIFEGPQLIGQINHTLDSK